MEEIKEYYLYVYKKDLNDINESMNKLLGYITSKVSSNCDPEHGFVTKEAEFLSNCIKPLEKITDNLSLTKKRAFDNNSIEKARNKLAGDIISCIQEKNDSVNLLLRLINILENYEIIGRKKYTKEHQDEYPF